MEIRSGYTPGGIEYRTAASGLRIEGYGAVYYNANDPDSQYKLPGFQNAVERIMPGAFDNVLREAGDVRGLYNHDSNFVLGRTAAGTMTLRSTVYGLRYIITPPPTTAAETVIEALRRGDVTGSSFSFKIESEHWHRDGKFDVREIRSVSPLYDIGPVCFPAYKATTATIITGKPADSFLFNSARSQSTMSLVDAEALIAKHDPDGSLTRAHAASQRRIPVCDAPGSLLWR